MIKDYGFTLNGQWQMDYLGDQPYFSQAEPEFDPKGDCIVSCPVPGYWEDMTDLFRTTPLHAKLKWNPLYTLQRYPQAGYVPDMALPNPVGCFVYKRSFTLSPNAIANGAELWFGGVQNAVSVWLNGSYIGRHEGYSAAFSFRLPADALVEGPNRITLAVSNTRLSGYQGRPISGLTSRAANECTGGIYGDVEIRFYPDGLKDLWVTTAEDLSRFTVFTDGALDSEKAVTILDGTKEVLSTKIPAGQSQIQISTENFTFWSPDTPKLYTAVVSTEHQRLTNRFGIRRLTVRSTKLFLNGKPYFFRGSCEHCYHPITVHPTREKNHYRKVIRTLKALGFNSIRFHTYVPMAEYMEAADELGMLIEIETPNNTTFAQWQDIVAMAKHYTSPVLYSSGNEMVIDEEYIQHLRTCAELVHSQTDSLFSPMSAMRGIEYHSYGDCKVENPFPHNPKRLSALNEFCDVYNNYSHGLTSYYSDKGIPALLDSRNAIYGKPLLSHEICIGGTYIDLSLKDRYQGSRIGDTELFSSVERHLAQKGLLDRANLYYRNSAHWQRILRKACFETLRRCDSFAGYDFLGDIDTHWHTFGYCVGMMNEFYELKAGETKENVRRYNSDAVLLADLPSCRNLEMGTKVEIPLLVSNYAESLRKSTLTLRLSDGKTVYLRRRISIPAIEAGAVTPLYRLCFTVPKGEKPLALKLSASLSGGNTDAENEWELWAFPKTSPLPGIKARKQAKLSVASQMPMEELLKKLQNGERVLLFGADPFTSVETSFQISIAGRTTGHLATAISDHPLLENLPHEGYCSWQFREMLNSGRAVVLDQPDIPFAPIIEIASSYKNAKREAMLFEYRVGNGKLLVSSLQFPQNDPAACWLKEQMILYAMSDAFQPKTVITPAQLLSLGGCEAVEENQNANEAANKNDITMN